MSDYNGIESTALNYHDHLSEEEGAEEKYFQVSPRSRRNSPRRWVRQEARTILLHLIFLVFNVVALISFASGWLTFRDAPDPHDNTPLRHVISYQERPFELQSIYLDSHKVNPVAANRFNGPPRPELEDAWETLLHAQNVRVQKGELGEFANDDSVVQLADGSGDYYSTVAVFHGLHCIQRLHNTIYPETYYPGLSDEETFDLRRHTEHCLDWLREYLQCNADTSLIPIQWGASSPGPIATDTGKHQCVAWEPIQDWMASRAFNPSEPGLLVHPVFGNPYNQSDQHHALGIIPLGQGGVLHGNGHH